MTLLPKEEDIRWTVVTKAPGTSRKGVGWSCQEYLQKVG